MKLSKTLSKKTLRAEERRKLARCLMNEYSLSERSYTLELLTYRHRAEKAKIVKSCRNCSAWQKTSHAGLQEDAQLLEKSGSSLEPQANSQGVPPFGIPLTQKAKEAASCQDCNGYLGCQCSLT